MEFLSKIFTIFAVATLPFIPGPVYAWPFVFFILAAAVLQLLLVLGKRTTLGPEKLSFWAKLFCFFFLFLILGSINSALFYGFDYTADRGVFIDFFLLAVYMLGFLLVFFHATDPRFRRGVFIAFLSPLIFAPFIFMPDAAKPLTLVSGTNMFEGLLKGEPTSFASFALMPFILLAALFVREVDWKRRAPYFIGMTLAASLVLWSGIRSAWLIALFSAIFILVFEFKHRTTRRAAFVATALFLLSLSAAVSFFLLPHDAQISILNRIFPQVTDYTYSGKMIEGISLKKAIDKIISNPVPSLPAQERSTIWSQSVKLLAENPFGLGIDYHVSSHAILQDGFITTAHNLFLETGLQGGIGALIILIFLLKEISFSLKNAPEKSTEWLVLALAVLNFFSIAFVSNGFWGGGLIVAALILSLERRNDTDIRPSPR